MTRTTGGSELGATSTRSRSSLSAYSMASLMCLIPSCSPLSEMRRTERVLIWSFILGSSSAATVHHSFQNRTCGAIEPLKRVCQKHRADADPYVCPRLYLRDAIAVYKNHALRSLCAYELRTLRSLRPPAPSRPFCG